MSWRSWLFPKPEEPPPEKLIGMDREEIIQGVVDLLRLYKDVGSIHQEPYRGDFFKFFAAAFNGGLIANPTQPGYLSANALADTLAERAPEVVSGENFRNLHTFWQEWTYACRRGELRH